MMEAHQLKKKLGNLQKVLSFLQSVFKYVAATQDGENIHSQFFLFYLFSQGFYVLRKLLPRCVSHSSQARLCILFNKVAHHKDG